MTARVEPPGWMASVCGHFTGKQAHIVHELRPRRQHGLHCGSGDRGKAL
jgi:hypothetical protein